VSLGTRIPARGAVIAVDLNSRVRPERTARGVARRAFSSRAARSAAILFKKIDSTLKGHIAAELSAIRRSLGDRPVLFAPAFPGQGRTTRNARLVLNGKSSSADLRALLARAGMPATHFDLAAVRGARLYEGFSAAMKIGARGLICDAESDTDLDRIARAGLALRKRPLFMGSGGLARAIARTLPRKRAVRGAPAPWRPVVTVVGSASAVSAGQARRLARDGSALLVQLAWTREPATRDIASVRRLGRVVAQAAPRAHFVLTGGETARAVLGARRIREIRLLGEVEPGVPFGIARDGTLVCTKAGAFGKPDTLAKCVARLKREMKRT
jgi:uncharacterized protein YgbK (DUF1537 family)